MENFKGTKGKWRLSISYDGDLVSDIEIMQPSKLVCLIHKHKTIEGIANAQLIAHAPEMLEAMQEFCERVERGEVRSRKTYAKFKDILTRATTI